MVMQLSLNRCGVVPCIQDGPARGASRTPLAQATGAHSEARSELNTQTGPKLTTMHWNAEGVQRKKLELQNFLKEHHVDICCIQETHLNPNLRFSIRGYTTYRHDRLERHKGGVLTLVKNSYPSAEINRSKANEGTETLTVLVTLPDRDLTVINIYSASQKIQLPPRKANQADFLALGDFNSHSPSWGYQNINAKGEDVEQWMTDNQLVLINKPDDEPSYYSRAWKTTTSPDLAIATDNLHKIAQRTVCKQLGGSDHKPITIHFEKLAARQEKLPPSWNYKKANWKVFMQLSDELTSDIDTTKVDKSSREWTDAILQAAQESIPRGRRRNYKPFWSRDLEDLHNKLSTARDALEQEPSDRNAAKYRSARTEFDQLKTQSIQSSWKEKTQGLNFSTNSKKLWQLTKTLNEDNGHYGKTTLVVDDKHLSGKEAGNVFAKQYEAVSTIEVSKNRIREVRQESRELTEQQQGPSPNCMSDSFHMRELNLAIKKLKNKKAPGVDGVTNDMLKHLGPTAKSILLKIFNSSWHSGKFPTRWKEAQIRPSLKKGKDKKKPDSYRPISLLSCTGKLLERLVNKRLLWYLESNNILSPTQTGYRQHRGIEDQLAYLTQDIQDGFSDGKKTLAVFFDLSKAFDTVWKEGLLLKLQRCGIQGKMIKWIKDFLFQRTARVKLDGTLSNLVKIREGVPQGGVISPILFLVYINDITKVLPRQVLDTLHADDLAIWSKEVKTATAAVRIQEAVTNVNNWTKTWALNLNLVKTVLMLFTMGPKESIRIQLQGQPIPQVERAILLGTTLDTRLTFSSHIDSIQAKALKKLSIMRKLAGTKWGANIKILKQVYAGLVRPITEHASTTWTSASKTNKDRLDKVQNAGLRIILGAMKSTPIKEMEKTADIQPLDNRRQYKILLQGEKAKRLPSHPIHDKLQARTKNRLQKKTLNHALKKLQSSRNDLLGGEVETLKPEPWLPKPGSFVLNFKVEGIEAKKEHPPEELRALTTHMIQVKYPSHTWIRCYTDGSADQAVKNGGSGIYTTYPDKVPSSISVPAGKRCTNYKAEVFALLTASESMRENTGKCIVFLTDCLSTMQDLESGPTESQSQELLKTLLNLSSNNKVIVQWVPSHIGLLGNDKADCLAKQGSRMQQPEVPSSYREIRTILRQRFLEDWRESNSYNPAQDDIHRLDRCGQSTIFRLRTGHCGLRKHLSRIGQTDTPFCPCGEEQTVGHVLQLCPIYDQLRQGFWPESPPIKEKLFGDLLSLQKTVDFVAATDLNI